MTSYEGRREKYQSERQRMVERLQQRGIRDERVLAAMSRIPRHCFEPEFLGSSSYEDCAWPISAEHTLGRPYHIARACELAGLSPHDRVLVIGAGSGFQAAVLSQLCGEVTQLELTPERAESTRRTLAELGIANVSVVLGDGSPGHAAAAPYDAILVAAGVPRVPAPLVDQLARDGRLIVPLGSDFLQHFTVLRRTEAGTESHAFEACTFTPLRRWKEATHEGHDRARPPQQHVRS